MNADMKELHELREKEAKLEVAVEILNDNIKEAQRTHSKTVNQLNEVKKEIRSIGHTEIHVSEHAIVRYVERALQVDVESIKAEILNDNIKTLIETLGDGKYPIGHGFKAVVRNKVIVTVV